MPNGNTVYIAGPMTGIPNYNYDAFHEAEEFLVAMGYSVVNPARNFGGDQSLPYEEYIKRAVQDLCRCDWLYCLPGWEHSRGARTEVHLAKTLGMEIWEETPNGAMPVTVDDYGNPKRERLTRVADYQGAVDGQGYKASMDTPQKLPISLIPPTYLMAAARALQHGAAKYAPNNWRRGMPFSEAYSALMRHLLAWWGGEDTDPDSGLHHLDHAAASLAFLIEFTANPRYAALDDRVK